MKIIVQRVTGVTKINSELEDEGIKEEHVFDGPGLVVLLGWEEKDVDDIDELIKKEEWLRSRVEGIRIFPDTEGRMNLNLSDYIKTTDSVDGGILWVPQFTLAAHLKSGFRPSFTRAMNPKMAKMRFAIWRNYYKDKTYNYQNLFGVFGAEMNLQFTNWGPVTIPLE